MESIISAGLAVAGIGAVLFALPIALRIRGRSRWLLTRGAVLASGPGFALAGGTLAVGLAGHALLYG